MNTSASREAIVRLKNAATLFLFYYGTWKLKTPKQPTQFKPFQEAMGYIDFNSFSVTVMKTAWTKNAWGRAIYLLQERGLVNFIGVNPADGLPIAALTSASCMIRFDSIKKATPWLFTALGGRANMVFETDPVTQRALTAVWNESLDPKEPKTWKKFLT